MQNRTLSALVFGGTGAIGQLLVQQLLLSPRWGKVIVVGRSALPQWSSPTQSPKLQISQISMDSLSSPSNFTYPNIDTIFCCLGSQTKHGDQTFIKIDKTYPLYIADIAKLNGIPHYSLVSSIGANPTSWFLYPRTKGEVEMELGKKGLEVLSIFRPGLLENRKGARFVEKVASWVPFMPKIEAGELAKCLRVEAERSAQEGGKGGKVRVYENSEILAMIP